MSTSATSQVAGESELWSAIAAFERILEVMPTDRLALETLSDAYQKLGDITRATEYTVRLAEAVIHDRDAQAGEKLLEKMKLMAKGPGIPEARSKLEALIKTDAEAAAGRPGGRKGADITREISLAWDLLQAGQINQEDYSHVVADLSENISKRVDVPVTVLHALNDRQFKGLDRVIAYLSKLSGKPVIPLSNFEITKDALSQLPIEFMSRRGAIVFELMGQDALVAVLSPLDKDLQDDVKRITRKRCHFYVVSPTDYDAALANIKKVLAQV